MKKIICLIVIALMVASVALAAAIITAKDLPGLKGTWVGSLHFGTIAEEGGSSACTLEIFNDTVPVRGKLTLWSVSDAVASYVGLMGGKNEFDLDEGQLTSQGTIYWSGGPEKKTFEVSMGSGKKLNATYWFRSLKGSAILQKK